MAISMSGATVQDSARQALLSKSVNGSLTEGGATLNTETTGGLFNREEVTTGAALAGVTASFATNVTAKIEEYISGIDGIIDELTNVANNVAFQGEGLEAALNNFVGGVKEVAKNYTKALKDAENQIINSVSAAYKTQDTDVSGNLGSDQSTLVGNNTFTVS